jgi:hypothetical protein
MSTDVLPAFEGHDVRQAQVKITNAGDGLSEALKIAPHALDIGDEVFYVLRGVCRQINHKQADDDDPVVRVHTVKAEEITEVDRVVAVKMLSAAASELEKAKAEAAGQLSLEAEKSAEEREAND